MLSSCGFWTFIFLLQISFDDFSTEMFNFAQRKIQQTDDICFPKKLIASFKAILVYFDRLQAMSFFYCDEVKIDSWMYDEFIT